MVRGFASSRALACALVCAAAACLASNALANFTAAGVKQLEEYRAPEIRLRWIDPYGKLFDLPWKVATKWEWVEHPQKLPVRVPVLRSWIEIPGGWEIAAFQSSNMVQVTEPAPPPFGTSGGIVAVVDTQALVARGTLILKDDKGQLHEYGILMEPSFIEPTIMTSDSCLDYNIEIQKKQGKAHYLYNAISCDLVEQGAEQGIDIYVFFSPDAQWSGSKFRGKLTKGNGWIMYHLPMPKATTKVPLGYVQVTDYKNSGATIQRVIYDGEAASQRFRMNAGLSATLMNYTEEPRAIKVTDIALTAKFIASYVIIPDKFEVSANVYATALTLTHSPSTLDTARFLGINTRFGWQIPGSWLDGRWQVLTGWYFWSMSVPGTDPSRTYGVQALSGPQVFVLYRTSHRRSRNLYVYGKFAPIVDNLQHISLSNNEIAGGIGYQLSRPSAPNPIFLTLDYARAAFKAFGLVNEMTLTSYSVGASINL